MSLFCCQLRAGPEPEQAAPYVPKWPPPHSLAWFEALFVDGSVLSITFAALCSPFSTRNGPFCVWRFSPTSIRHLHPAKGQAHFIKKGGSKDQFSYYWLVSGTCPAEAYAKPGPLVRQFCFHPWQSLLFSKVLLFLRLDLKLKDRVLQKS